MSPTKKPLQTHLFTYEHDGAEWVLAIKATDADDARARMSKLAGAAYDGVAISVMQTTLAVIAVTSILVWTATVRLLEVVCSRAYGRRGARRAQTHPEIGGQVKRRLADEYDAAQQRREVAGHGGARHINVPNRNVEPSAADLGLSRKDIHEARQIRDAEQAEHGERTIDRGGAPS